MTSPLTTSSVARLLGKSEATIRRLDQQLRPVKTATGLRLYDEAIVREYAATLAAKPVSAI